MATIVLLVYPLFALLLFRSLPFLHALVAVLLGGMLLLPSNFSIEISGFPDIDRTLVTIGTVVLCALIYHGSYLEEARRASSGPPAVLPGWLPREPLILALLAAVVVGTLLTYLTNGAPTNIGWRPEDLRPALALKDLAGMIFSLAPLAVFLVGRRYFFTPESHRILLVTFVTAALIYTLPALWEIRMSPRLHVQVYGFFPHNWIQVYREGWRPQVFMQHGLALAIFNTMALLAALALWRSAPQERKALYLLGAAWIGATLALSNSLGALLITMALVPVVLFLSPRLQLLLAGAICLFVLLYPVLRGAGISPLQYVVDFLQPISPERAGSLDFRLENEARVLERASEKPLFGWGGWGRWMVVPEGFRSTPPLDGFWVITIGSAGWVGFLGLFGLLTAPVIAHLRKRRIRTVAPITAGLAVVLAAKVFDLIPNAFASPLIWLIGGALAGHLEYVRVHGIQPGGANPAPAVAGRVSRPAQARTRAAGPMAMDQGAGRSTAPIREDGERSRYTRFSRTVPARRRERDA